MEAKNAFDFEILSSEIELMQGLADSPWVIEIFDSQRADNKFQLAIVMELAVCDFGQWLQKRESAENHLDFSATQIINFAEQMCAAVCQVHRQGIMHCDLKPENLVVVHVSDPQTVRYSQQRDRDGRPSVGRDSGQSSRPSAATETKLEDIGPNLHAGAGGVGDSASLFGGRARPPARERSGVDLSHVPDVDLGEAGRELWVDHIYPIHDNMYLLIVFQSRSKVKNMERVVLPFFVPHDVNQHDRTV